jgi:rare lipoprotein A
MTGIRLLSVCAGAVLLAACVTTPPPQKKVNPITRLPPQTKPVPKPQDRPAFGTHDFNVIKDAAPDAPVDVSQVPDAEPVEEPLSAYGNRNPYTVLGETYELVPTIKGFRQSGGASWYGKKFHGLKTSSGEKYDMYKMTAAHRNLPLPTYIRVTNKANRKSVIVKVNDRGPFHSERILDLSYAAAAKLDMLKTGTAQVEIEALDPAEFQRKLGTSGKPTGSAASTDIAAGSNFYVQVGAFGELANATALQSKLLELIYAPVVIARTEAPALVHRVQIGPFFTLADADKVAQIIRDGELGTPIVVKR